MLKCDEKKANIYDAIYIILNLMDYHSNGKLPILGEHLDSTYPWLTYHSLIN